MNLIVFASKEGQTEKIAKYLARGLQAKGESVEVSDISQAPDPSQYDRIIVAASVHVSNYPKAVANYLKKHQSVMASMTSAFISVSMTAAGEDGKAHENLHTITEKFLQSCNWKPDIMEYAAGALMYSRYNFITKWVMRKIAKASDGSTDTSQDVEYTDWGQLDAFLDAFLTVQKAS